MARGFSYIVKRDFGFAPNPFYGFLTLATCKPKIRKYVRVGDYIIGNSDKASGNKLIYMAKTSKIITFDEYWQDPNYACKKSIMNGSYKKLYGDNIYHHEDEIWMQEDSHHSNEDGSTNMYNLKRDTGMTDNVLIAEEFFYFGKSMFNVPEEYEKCIHRGIGHHCPDEMQCIALWSYLHNNYEMGLIDTPNLFKNFTRYDGQS